MAEPAEIREPPAVDRETEPWPRGTRRMLPLIKDHLGLLVSGAAFVLVALRVLSTADWNPTTAEAIVQAGGATNVALSSALSLGQLIATLVLISAMPWGCHVAYQWPTIPHHGSLLAIGGISAWLAAYLVSVAIMTIGLFCLAVAAVRGVVPRRRGTHSSPSSKYSWTRDDVPFALLAVLILASVAETSYLPRERLEAPDAKPFTGYVVGQRGDATLVLRRGQGIAECTTEDLTRELCEPTADAWGRTLVELLDKSPYPDCPDS